VSRASSVAHVGGGTTVAGDTDPLRATEDAGTGEAVAARVQASRTGAADMPATAHPIVRPRKVRRRTGRW
jgi:hypothetical protein